MQELLQNIELYKNIPLTDSDIKRGLYECNQDTNVVLYSQMCTYNSIDELIKPYNSCLILYEEKPNTGHWCCLTLHDNLLEYFDPYGSDKKMEYSGQPDSSLKFIPEPFRQESNQDVPYLSLLMLKCPYKLSYNEYQFQELDKYVKTCGRWCLLRICLKDLTLEQFRDLFFGNNSDNIATVCTADQKQL
jgi:hypothetical protein